MAQTKVGDLFMDTEPADVIFVVDDEEIPGHRLLLAKTCDYFDKLLFGDFLESKSKKVEISAVSAKVFREVMRFIYKGQLEVDGWTIEDLMSLLAVAHEYQFQTLFYAVIRAVEAQPLDFDSWPFVSSAASVYDSEELERKCTFFVESKIDDFIHEKDLENFSAEFICCMFDRRKMSSFNPDQVVKAIFNWQKGRSLSETMSVVHKIDWEKVSPKITAIILREFFSAVTNVGQLEFLSKLFPDIDRSSSSPALNDCVSRVDSIVLKKSKVMASALPYHKITLCGRLYPKTIEFWFMKDNSKVDFPVKRIEFEALTKFDIKSICGRELKRGFTFMDLSEVTSNNGSFKYSATFRSTTQVNLIYVSSQHFENISEICMKNILIY